MRSVDPEELDLAGLGQSPVLDENPPTTVVHADVTTSSDLSADVS